MTPTIKEFIRITAEPEKLMWFDIGHAPDTSYDFTVDGEFLTHLPYQRMAVCGFDAQKHKFMLYLLASANSVTVAGYVLWLNGKYEPIDPFAYIDTDEGVRLMPPNDPDRPLKKEDCMAAMSIIGYMLDSLDTGGLAYQPTIKTNSITNKRLIAKGKSALIYDWRTVVIKPKPPEDDALGGTHASPRQHERRGHWRVTSNGRKVWVRNCTVGNASKGTVFHDYRVTSEKQQ